MDLHLGKKLSSRNFPSFKAERYELNEKPRITLSIRRDFYKIWLISSEGTLKLMDQIIPINKPALVFLNPLIPYSFDPLEKKRTGYWCVFTEEFLANSSRNDVTVNSALFELDNPGIFFPEHRHLDVVNFLFEQVVFDFESDYLNKFESIKAKISLLIHEGNKMLPILPRIKKQNAAARIAAVFLNLLEEQYPIVTPGEPVKLKKPSDFAGKLAVHVNHLNAVVHDVTGKSTRNHIAKRMINESKALLIFSDWSIADISYSLGFDYPNHFNTFFKKHTGITPLSLRK